ncbi:hypothetical protein [Pedosphaera parvula]|uniref:Uncharacterized protein n=1 Tax=Pedosphaera parvula (strain Ellin514) TaxID=320771 RepID=B9XAF0_PEDPL|nr:hypothetical protein [Pedosphaera parvula]EEF62985.1 hypothetical protein Cflav_PD5620 [Pedosphaera parvula Ellin514]
MSNSHLISPTEASFLNLKQLPACLNPEQTAALLGRRPEHIPILVEGGFLKPLGDPPKNGVKLFATCELKEKMQDVKWLDRINRHLSRHWQQKNSKKKQGHGDSVLPTEEAMSLGIAHVPVVTSS